MDEIEELVKSKASNESDSASDNEDEKFLKGKKKSESNVDISEPRDTGQTEHDEVDNEINGKNELSPGVTETVIKEAVLKRASYLRAEIEYVSLTSSDSCSY